MTRSARVAYPSVILIFVMVAMGCSFSLTQQPPLRSIEIPKTPIEPGSGVLMIESVHIRIKNPLQTEAPRTIWRNFVKKLTETLQGTELFSAVYKTTADDVPKESDATQMIMNVDVNENHSWFIFNQTIECQVELQDGVVRSYKSQAMKNILSSKRPAAEEVTNANLKSIAAQFRSDSVLLEAAQ